MKFNIATIIFHVITIAASYDFPEETSIKNSLNKERTENKGTVCDEVFAENQFLLQTPNYPKEYLPNLSCRYLLNGPLCPTYYKFEFLDFHLENSVGCLKDRLEIGNEDILCGKRSGIQKYYSANGTLHVQLTSDASISEKGYKILVTRMACEMEEKDFGKMTTGAMNMTILKDVPESTTSTFQLFPMPKLERNQKQCCETEYSSKRFVLTSPNFPYSLNEQEECTYRIQKASENICRLRLNFQFFWLGPTNYNNCRYGHLEIDGKFICGCNKELKLTTTFEDINIKTITFKSAGFKLDAMTGFVLEVIQDECPNKYHPEMRAARTLSAGFPILKAKMNNLRNFIEKLQSVNRKTVILDEDNNNYYRSSPQIVKSFYYFVEPEYNAIPQSSHDIEETTFIDTSSINSVVTNFNQYECLNWNQVQLHHLDGIYGSSLQMCKTTEQNENNSKSNDNCVELGYKSGYFRSPGYPFYYPGSLNMCYRLKKQPGYCGIRIFMNDFQIKRSFGCAKDYVLLGNRQKQCGINLLRQWVTFDLRNKEHEDIKFVTDDFYCGRGFSAIYQQIVCQDTTYPVNPDIPTPFPITTTTESPICGRFIEEKDFTIELGQNYRTCSFSIRTSSSDVCKINLNFEKFDIACGIESLVVDGMMFCGHLTGRKVSVNISSNEQKEIIYRSTLPTKDGNLRVRIIGEQINDDCLYPEVPAQRLIKLEGYVANGISRRLNNNSPDNNSKILISMRNEHLKDICGIVTNSTEKELPDKFCEILRNEHNVTQCIVLQNISSYVPYQSKKAELILENASKVEEIEYEEVDCDNFNLQKQ